jgi:hypothetical protein
MTIWRPTDDLWKSDQKGFIALRCQVYYEASDTLSKAPGAAAATLKGLERHSGMARGSALTSSITTGVGVGSFHRPELESLVHEARAAWFQPPLSSAPAWGRSAQCLWWRASLAGLRWHPYKGNIGTMKAKSRLPFFGVYHDQKVLHIQALCPEIVYLWLILKLNDTNETSCSFSGFPYHLNSLWSLKRRGYNLKSWMRNL